MKNADTKKKRFLSDPIPIRLGGMAANLARVRSFSKNLANRSAVFDLFEETKFFIEWTASETELSTAAELVELQLQIAIWQLNWDKNWNETDRREQLAESSMAWSQLLLERSGLLK